MKRRDDIQGLRALAIVGVHLYHLSSEDFPSGFLGVDVFFVISGYLITSILHKKHRNSDSWIIIKDFYFRRIRRICIYYLEVTSTILTVGHDFYSITGHWQWKCSFISYHRFCCVYLEN
ncbi:acyltransferase family domain-containing protein [Ditylenchus destructor]|nr:acyltransferase family domain-containing protein [Ditylenchus destructor]